LHLKKFIFIQKWLTQNINLENYLTKFFLNSEIQGGAQNGGKNNLEPGQFLELAPKTETIGSHKKVRTAQHC
jgi:hypothetical protein